MTGAEIAAKIIEQKDMDAQDRVLLKTISLQIAHTMHSQLQRKNVRTTGWRKLDKRKPMRVWALP
jgi:hypothetical protein